MACRYFEEGTLCRCGAVRGLLVPSIHERERFCHGDPSRCPTRYQRELRGEPLPEEVYYALWLPDPDIVTGDESDSALDDEAGVTRAVHEAPQSP